MLFNFYSKKKAKAKKEARRMVCDCTPPSKEETYRGAEACGDDCLNRMLMMEWYLLFNLLHSLLFVSFCISYLIWSGDEFAKVVYHWLSYAYDNTETKPDVFGVKRMYCEIIYSVHDKIENEDSSIQLASTVNMYVTFVFSGNRCPCGDACTNKRFQKVRFT